MNNRKVVVKKKEEHTDKMAKDQAASAPASREGKYLTFALTAEEYSR